MTEETNAGTEVAGEDTAAVLNYAAGERTYLEPKAEEQPPVEDEQPGDDAAAETETEGQGETPEKPKRQSAQDRIDELTRARREAEREAAHWKRIANEGRQPEPKPEPQAATDGEPDADQYQYGQADPGYIRDLARFEARKEFRAESERQQRETQVRTIEQTWEDRQRDFAKENPDYFERVYTEDLPISPVMADALKTSEEGARVAYHLAQNPDEARRIAALNPLAQVRELGRLEAKLSAPAPAAEPESTPQPKTVSDAPAPHPQARGLKGQFKPAADTTDFAAFERAYVNRDG